ncbi:MAG: hypothetical protein K0S04_4404 [Herbinix sp.]|jgi:hypothetical protein|nr:hypothetical protein [Herbinix sp.]
MFNIVCFSSVIVIDRLSICRAFVKILNICKSIENLQKKMYL